MHVNEYTLEVLARDRLEEMRAEAERLNRVRAARSGSRSLRASLGRALVRLGHRLQGARRDSEIAARTRLFHAARARAMRKAS